MTVTYEAVRNNAEFFQLKFKLCINGAAIL